MHIHHSKQTAFTLIELLVVISIIAILAGIALPVFGEVQIRGAQTKQLSNAKQIGTACKIYATDNNGIYPHTTDYPAGSAATPTEAASGDASNKVLHILIPDYLPDANIFSNLKSAFCKKPVAATATEPLPIGTNEWAYVSGLTDTSTAIWPLLADGFATVATGLYSTDITQPGGVWQGKKAIVIRCDGSGVLETLPSTGSLKLTVKRTATDTTNPSAFVGDSSTPTAGSVPWFPAASTTIFVLNPTPPAP